MTEKAKGYTYAEAEYIGDKELLSRISRAEKTSGIKTGPRFGHADDGSTLEHRVSVSFYPKTRFHLEDRDGDRYVNRRELSDDEYEATHGLNL